MYKKCVAQLPNATHLFSQKMGTGLGKKLIRTDRQMIKPQRKTTTGDESIASMSSSEAQF